MTSDNQFKSSIPTDVPAAARAHGWLLGGKDNYESDRRFVLDVLPGFPQWVDLARQNRRFLHRAVRHLVKETGIRQFLDLGCGLPNGDNVHQVAQSLAPETRVVYVDSDPIVLAHGRAMLASSRNTALIMADMRDPEEVFDDPGVRRLIDFDEPVAVLFLSVGHHLTDADEPRETLRTIIDQAVPGSHLCFSQIVCDDPARGAALSERVSGAGVPWRIRTPAEVDALLDGLEPVAPGLGNIAGWRPDPAQPPLAPVDPELAPYLGATERDAGLYQYGGVLRRP